MKELGAVPAVFPMPVLMIGTYDENGKIDVMNAAWGTQCAADKVLLCLSSSHKTVKNLLKTKAFTVALASPEQVVQADYFGIASGNTTEDKFEKSGLHAEKSAYVNAPVIREFPVTMECELLEEVNTENLHCFVGRIVNTTAAESSLKDDGKLCPVRVNALIFDQFQANYFALGQKVGKAWGSGKELL